MRERRAAKGKEGKSKGEDRRAEGARGREENKGENYGRRE